MGYTTDFRGHLNIEPPLPPEVTKYIQDFTTIRHMIRDVEIIKELFPEATGWNGDLGVDGEFFIDSAKLGNFGQVHDRSVLDYNEPPATQPALWCQWAVNDEGTRLEWNGAEKFYGYIDWLFYLKEKFINPSGSKLSGKIEWRGEDFDDRGVIEVLDDEVSITE